MDVDYPQIYPPFYPQESERHLLNWFGNTHIVRGQ
jgi:hypothetical protein